MAKYVPADVVSTTPYVGVRPKLRYRKSTPGSFEMFGMLIKPGQFIQAFPEEIEPVKQHFNCMDTEEMQALAVKRHEEVETKVEEVVDGVKKTRVIRTTRPIPNIESLYAVVENDEKTGYNVINVESKKILNEVPLTKEEADLLQNTLNT